MSSSSVDTSHRSAWLPIAASAASLLATGVWYSGALSEITFRRGTIDPCSFFYKTFNGPYKGVGPLFADVEAFLKTHKLADFACVVPAGIYYDNPASLQEGAEPRCALGFLVSDVAGGDDVFWKKWEAIPESDRNAWARLDLPRTRTAVSSFPRTRLLGALSCVLSAIKTYPAFRAQTEFALVAPSGTLEVYSPTETLTHFPQEQQEKFGPGAVGFAASAD